MQLGFIIIKLTTIKEKNEKLKKQASEYETERKDFVNRLNKIYELTVSDQADTNKITQIHELTKY